MDVWPLLGARVALWGWRVGLRGARGSSSGGGGRWRRGRCSSAPPAAGPGSCWAMYGHLAQLVRPTVDLLEGCEVPVSELLGWDKNGHPLEKPLGPLGFFHHFACRFQNCFRNRSRTVRNKNPNFLGNMPFLHCKISTFSDWFAKSVITFDQLVVKTWSLHFWVSFLAFFLGIPIIVIFVVNMAMAIMAEMAKNGSFGHYGHGHFQVKHDNDWYPQKER